MMITQLEKLDFINGNELKLTQVELFQFFRFMCVAANASELFCMAHLANIEYFFTPTRELEFMKINSTAKRCDFSRNGVKLT